MKMDALKYKYPSRRTLVYGSRGMTATTQPLAAQAGLEMLRRGGNAVDAAVAMIFANSLTEPGATSLGGASFMTITVICIITSLN